MRKYFYYNSWDIFLSSAHNVRNDIPGGDRFKDVFKCFSPNITFFDRTGTFDIPLKIHELDFLKIPQFEYNNTSFEDITDERAEQLFQHAKNTNRKIAIMYSGGIDSTTVVCSFIRTRTKEELKQHFVILMSEISIEENPTFAEKFIFKYFNVSSSFRYTSFLGNDDYILVSGENADQLFGSQVNDTLAEEYRDYKWLFEPIKTTEDKIISYFKWKLHGSKERSKFLYDTFTNLCSAAPIPIDTAYNFFWWINFTTKWQSVYVRMIPFSHNISNVKLEENYTTFFYTQKYQLWSMNNYHNFLAESREQHTVKWPAKKYISTVTLDNDYDRKKKIGSLWRLVLQKNLPKSLYIDEDGIIKPDYENPTQEYYIQNNHFN